MLPPPRKRMDPKDYEKVPVGDWVLAEIKEIEYDMEHKKTFQGKTKVGPSVRFVFQVTGCKFDHKSRWMSFGYGEKFNLFTKYVKKLVKGAVPDMSFDLDALKGMRIRMIWENDGDYQNIEMVKPAGEMITVKFTAPPESDDVVDQDADAAPEEDPYGD